MGSVYRAHHILMDKPVAVKVLRHELSCDTEAVARFHREARSASRLDHESIIRVTDFGQTDDGLLFLVMELLDGENLAQSIRKEPLPWRRAATIAREMAQGLAHAHEQGVIHRDLKPENVVVLRRGKGRLLVKVLDFGLAKLVRTSPDSAPDPDEEPGKNLTKTGVVFGTPEYMSPEQAEGKTLGPHTDLYALGVVLYQMVTGQLPFSAPTFLALIAKTVHEAPRPPSQVVPEKQIPVALEELILRCLEKLPDDRPASADEIADELDALLAQHVADETQERLTSVTPASGSVPKQDVSKNPAELSATNPPGGVAKTVQRVPVSPVPPVSSVSSVSSISAVLSSSKDPTPKETPRAVASAFSAWMDQEGPTKEPPKPHPVPVAPSRPDAVAESPFANELDEKTQSEAPSQDAVPAVSEDDLEQESTGLRNEAPLLERSEQSASSPVALPQRPYWLLGVFVLVALGAVSAVFAPTWLRKVRAVEHREIDELQKAKQLLETDKTAAGQQAALRVLLALRQTQDTTDLHQLLSRAYESQNNRLRALGHAHLAVQRAKTRTEYASAELALSQLLSRQGHVQEACQTALLLLHEKPVKGKAAGQEKDKEVLVHAQALIATLHCTIPEKETNKSK